MEYLKKYSKSKFLKSSDKLGSRIYFIPFRKSFKLFGFRLFSKMHLVEIMAYSESHAEILFAKNNKQKQKRFWEIECLPPIIDIEFISYMANTNKCNNI